MKEKEFLKIVKDLDSSKHSQYNLIFCNFYLHSNDEIRSKLFKNFPELVNKITEANKLST